MEILENCCDSRVSSVTKNNYNKLIIIMRWNIEKDFDCACWNKLSHFNN